MSDESNPSGTPAPIATPLVVATPSAEPPKPHVPASALPDDALAARLASAKATGQKELLTQVGAQSPDEIKAALELYRTSEAAKKTEAEKLAAETLARQTAEHQAQTYRTALDGYKAQESAKLTDEQRAAVDAIAGDDPAQWVKTLTAIRPTWGQASVAPPPAVPPANTAPNAGAPPPTGTTSPPNIKAHYEALLARNPVVAAQFAEKNSKAIFG